MVKRRRRYPSRRPPRRKLRDIILIVCEGEKTEPLYFNKLKRECRLSSLNIHCDIVSGRRGQSLHNLLNVAIMKKAERSGDEFPYNIVWCIIDVEIPPQNMDKALRLARENSIGLILTNPSFEYWYLLHFGKTSASFGSNSQLINTLKSHLPQYSKTSMAILSQIYERTDQAIKNAKELASENGWPAEDLRNHNPSTRVHDVVEHLKNMAEG